MKKDSRLSSSSFGAYLSTNSRNRDSSGILFDFDRVEGEKSNDLGEGGKAEKKFLLSAVDDKGEDGGGGGEGIEW